MMRKRGRVVLAALAFCVMMTSCGAKNSADENMETTKKESVRNYKGADLALEGQLGYDMNDAEYTEEDGGEQKTDTQNKQQSSEKLIYRASLSLQTLEYDTTIKKIRDELDKYKGFVENEQETDSDTEWYYYSGKRYDSRRNMVISVRVPSESFYDFIEGLPAEAKVMNRNVKVENISQTYADTEASKKALEIEEERLLDMMKEAQGIDEMLRVEERLTQVQDQLNRYKTSLSYMDREVEYSSVTLRVEEVKEYTETKTEKEDKSYGQRLSEGFSNAWASFVEFWQDLLLWVVERLPFLIMLAVIAVAVIIPVRHASKKKKAARASYNRQTQGAKNMNGRFDNGAPSAGQANATNDKNNGNDGKSGI